MEPLGDVGLSFHSLDQILHLWILVKQIQVIGPQDVDPSKQVEVGPGQIVSNKKLPPSLLKTGLQPRLNIIKHHLNHE